MEGGFIADYNILNVELGNPLRLEKCFLYLAFYKIATKYLLNICQIAATHLGGAYNTKFVIQTSTTCLFVPFGPLFEKTFEFFDFGVILRCL